LKGIAIRPTIPHGRQLLLAGAKIGAPRAGISHGPLRPKYIFGPHSSQGKVAVIAGSTCTECRNRAKRWRVVLHGPLRVCGWATNRRTGNGSVAYAHVTRNSVGKRFRYKQMRSKLLSEVNRARAEGAAYCVADDSCPVAYCLPKIDRHYAVWTKAAGAADATRA